MTIFRVLGNEFLKLTLSERQYKILIAREGKPPEQITTTLNKAVEIHKEQRIVKASGNSGHVYVPKAWVGKTVIVTLIEECIYK